jgi:hypothetical protein
MQLLLFYFNMYWLILKPILKERYLACFLWIMAISGVNLICLYIGRYYLKPYFKNPGPDNMDAPNVFPFVVSLFIFVAVSSAIKQFQISIVVNQRVNELEKVTIQSEREQLKNQINPHFLFNMLNKANVLTQKDPKMASRDYIVSGKLLQGIRTWFSMCDKDRLSVIAKFRVCYHLSIPQDASITDEILNIAFCKFPINELLKTLII